MKPIGKCVWDIKKNIQCVNLQKLNSVAEEYYWELIQLEIHLCDKVSFFNLEVYNRTDDFMLDFQAWKIIFNRIGFPRFLEHTEFRWECEWGSLISVLVFPIF
ncbi:hypothetical protein NQ315_001941 [Exocentrus adspersus]|uniref:Uncharacterized protein n=1 Tax=Exocentrus adspersus TaxID=1586481 RepID=A0AAV8WA07_9CUCU|nr:hypothetical protein NQ315_001941 [Exocentrus adspersus]